MRWIALLYFLCTMGVTAEEKKCSHDGKSRVKSLVQWEEAMNWVVPFSSRTFALKEGKKASLFQETSEDMNRFVSLHGYFSCYKPLVGLVTDDPSDLDPIQEVFFSLSKHKNLAWAQFATEELLTKAVAYRNLQKGIKIFLPSPKKRSKLIEYVFDEVLDLWQGMPAFGLLPIKKEGSPILLFRGTDFSFTSKSSWASILSDFDLTGAGLTTFKGSESKIEKWLQNAASIGKTKVMGFSLGGILAIYTSIFKPDLVDLCIAFNAPGISKAIFKEWKDLPNPPPLFTYATQGDLISRFGQMAGRAFEVSDKAPMGPIEAHTKIMTSKSPLLLFSIDIEKENKSRFRADL